MVDHLHERLALENVAALAQRLGPTDRLLRITGPGPLAFNNADDAGRLRLSLRGTVGDLEAMGIEFREGMPATFYDGDELAAEGTVRFSNEEQIWVGVINWDE